MADSSSKGNGPGNSQKGDKRRTIIVWKKCCFGGIRKKEEDTIFQMQWKIAQNPKSNYTEGGTDENSANAKSYGSRLKKAAK